MTLVGSFGSAVAKKLAPGVTGPVVRDILERAIDGAGPIPGAARSGDSQLRRANGNVNKAIESLIDNHLRLAGAQGFLTNVGGLVTMAVTMPTNLAAVALIQCHLAASIVHLRGYSLDRPEVRDAILVCLLDKDARKALSKDSGTTISPAFLLDAGPSPQRSEKIARAVTGQLLAGIGGKRVASFVARRIPVLGGAVGGFGDALATRRIGRDTAELVTNPRQQIVNDEL